MPHLSIVSPVYYGEKFLEHLILRINNAVKGLTDDFEIILVEDCSPDNSWNKIKELTKVYSNVRGYKLTRNFGQHYAITCGLDHADGEWVVVMDCDLQDRPEEIPALYKKAMEGYDVVFAQRYNRQDSFSKKLFSRIFYKTLGYLSGNPLDEKVANFGIYHKKVIKAVCSLRESIRNFSSMVRWVGFNQTAIPVAHGARAEGKSSYNYKRLFNLALDIILAYSDKPIRLMIKFGLIVSLISFLLGLNIFIRYFLGKVTVQGYSSIIISICFFSGLILVMLGVVGLYVGKTFEVVKNRPIYIIKETV